MKLQYTGEFFAKICVQRLAAKHLKMHGLNLLHILNLIVLQLLDGRMDFVCIPIPLGIDLKVILSIVEAQNFGIL